MRIKKITCISFLMLLLSLSISSCKLSREEKTRVIIEKMNLVQAQQENYSFMAISLEYATTAEDSQKINEIEEMLSDEEVYNRISDAFTEVFSDNDINDLYEFIQTDAYDKIFVSDKLFDEIELKFEDLEVAIDYVINMSNSYIESDETNLPFPIDRENGFYEVGNYYEGYDMSELEFKAEPSVSMSDILEVKKTYNNMDVPEISITFTEEGSQNFYILTEEYIGYPIAIVVDKFIIAMPIVMGPVDGGKATISGNFTEDEIDEIVKSLQPE
ncbi:MAG: hypothetical protein C0592_13910 [Marinilabiliales bacterium]|nr:MAG: hypothetical protein C0592_13910 [Marinilabiliales bacterium]